MKTTITYTAYNDLPKATEFSRNMTFLTGGISLFGLLVIAWCFLIMGKLCGFVSLVVFLGLQIGLRKYKSKKIEEIIEQEIRDRQIREKRYREMNLRQKELDRVEEQNE